MLLNLGLNKKAPNIVTAPQSNIDVNAVLGLAPSQYEDLQSVGDTGYYYGDNKMYEPYTPSGYTYGRQTIFGFQPIPSWHAPSYNSPFGLTGGVSRRGGPASGTITRDGQSFRPVNTDITGFSKNKVGEEGSETYEYSPSMAYVYSQAPRPAPLPTPNVTSFLSSPTANTYVGSYGTDRFTQGNGLLGFDFGLPSGKSANE